MVWCLRRSCWWLGQGLRGTATHLGTLRALSARSGVILGRYGIFGATLLEQGLKALCPRAVGGLLADDMEYLGALLRAI